MVAKRTGLARARKAAAYTQESLAEALHVDATTIGNWETGRTEPLPYKRPKLAKLLRITAAELERLLRNDDAVSNSSPVAGPVSVTSPNEQTSPPVPGSGSTPPRRRISTPDSSTTTSASAIFPALNDDEQARVIEAIKNPRHHLDQSVLDAFHRQLSSSMNDDGAHGPAKTLPAVLGLLQIVERCAHEARPTSRRELLSLGARGAEFAGWLHRDSDDLESAVFWYDRAMEWAQEAGNFPLQGYILLKKSQMAYDQRNAARVLALARVAHEGPWQFPLRMQAEVTQQLALGMAMVGESLPAIERTLDNARTTLSQAPVDDSPDAFNAYFTDSTLLLRNASTYTEAGKPAWAARVFGEALADATLSHRDSGYFRARRSAALSLSGEPDEAAALGLHSIRVATTTDSRRTLRVLVDVAGNLTPWASRPLVRELQDAVAVSVSATRPLSR